MAIARQRCRGAGYRGTSWRVNWLCVRKLRWRWRSGRNLSFTAVRSSRSAWLLRPVLSRVLWLLLRVCRGWISTSGLLVLWLTGGSRLLRLWPGRIRSLLLPSLWLLSSLLRLIPSGIRLLCPSRLRLLSTLLGFISHPIRSQWKLLWASTTINTRIRRAERRSIRRGTRTTILPWRWRLWISLITCAFTHVVSILLTSRQTLLPPQALELLIKIRICLLCSGAEGQKGADQEVADE